ncbi:hypothetical protein DLV06_22000 [Shigella flexneri]|nr:hypothetical protein EGX88_01425 [Shigella flexneri]EAA0642877.1 hypothetical protein [Shigella flexneri]OXW80747.1 hypothetical protein CG416_25625 [Shigella flexneri]
MYSFSRYCFPRYFIRTPYNGVLASQTRHDYCPQSSMIRGVMSPWICPYISRHLLSLNPLQARCRRYSRGER